MVQENFLNPPPPFCHSSSKKQNMEATTPTKRHPHPNSRSHFRPWVAFSKVREGETKPHRKASGGIPVCPGVVGCVATLRPRGSGEGSQGVAAQAWGSQVGGGSWPKTSPPPFHRSKGNPWWMLTELGRHNGIHTTYLT